VYLLKGRPGDSAHRDLNQAASFRNMQHRLADRSVAWAGVPAVHLQAPPYFENVRALMSRSVAEQNTVFLPWGPESTVIPLVGAEDVSRIAAALLINSGLPPQNTYALVSETPTVKEITDALAGALGRPVRYVAISDQQWADAVKERLRGHALDHLSHLWQFFRNSVDGYQPTDSIRKLTGRKPQTLQEFFRENAAFFAASTQEA
jgi:uncharacterized protein YbjT (DUF2867 family)